MSRAHVTAHPTRRMQSLAVRCEGQRPENREKGSDPRIARWAATREPRAEVDETRAKERRGLGVTQKPATRNEATSQKTSKEKTGGNPRTATT